MSFFGQRRESTMEKMIRESHQRAARTVEALHKAAFGPAPSAAEKADLADPSPPQGERESVLQIVRKLIPVGYIPAAERQAQEATDQILAALRAAPSAPTREQVEALRKPPEPGIVYGVARPSYNKAIDDVLALYPVPAEPK